MRLLSRGLLALVLAPAIAFLALVASTPGSASGFGYATAFVVLGLSLLPRAVRTRRALALAGVATLSATVVLRVAFAGEGRTLTMSTPASTSARWLDRVLDEEDLAVNGARALVWTRLIPDPDVPALPGIMHAAYARMRDAEGATPSPVAATYLGLERPGQDDTIEIGNVAESHGVLVFLHGYAGSFTLPCWVISEAARTAGFATVCPSTRWIGDWWTADGEATLRETLVRLRARGASRIVLAGLSNGGVGASLLTPRMGRGIDGLILISGASPEAGPPGVPTLAIQGEHDSQIPASVVRAYARHVGCRYVSLDAGHFAMLAREPEAMSAVTAFLRERAPGASAASLGARR